MMFCWHLAGGSQRGGRYAKYAYVRKFKPAFWAKKEHREIIKRCGRAARPRMERSERPDRIASAPRSAVRPSLAA